MSAPRNGSDDRIDTGKNEREMNAKTDSDPKYENEATLSTDMKDGDDDEDAAADMPEQAYIRQRNAIYSRRKYYKKKHYIEQLKASRYNLETCNDKLRENNAQLESLVQRAKDVVAINEQPTALVMAQERHQNQLRALLQIQQRQRQVEATLANNSLATERYPQYTHIGGTVAHDYLMDRFMSLDATSFASLPNLTTSGVNTSITRQALQQGLVVQNNTLVTEPALPINQFLSTILRNPSAPTAAASSLSELNNELSFVPMPMIDTNPNNRSLNNTWLRQNQIEMSAAMLMASNHNSIPASIHDSLYANNNNNNRNSSLSVIEALKAMQDQQSFPNGSNIGNSSRSIIEALKSLQDQRSFRHTRNVNSSFSVAEALRSLQDHTTIRSTGMDVGNSSLAISDALISLQHQQRIRNVVNEHTQQQQQQQRESLPAAAAGIANATVAAHQHLLQNQSLDQNALLQYYLSLSGRRK